MNTSSTTLTGRLLASVIAAGGIYTTANAAPKSLGVYYDSYNNYQKYTQNMLDRDLKDVGRYGNVGDGNQSIRIYPSNSSNRRLMVKFKKGEFGGDQYTGVWSKLSKSNKYTLSYNFRFMNDWDWGRGGKLPGIAGGSAPAGGSPKTDGMSNRIMWLYDNQNGSRLVAYHYWRGQARAYNGGDNDRRYGDSTYLQGVRKNKWYGLGMQVKLNTGSGRGRLHIKVNSITKYNHSHTYLNSGATWKMDRFMNVFFYGGAADSWAPSQNTTLMFDNLKVTQSDL